MSKPVLVVVVDDAQTRQLLERDLEAKYGQRYSVYSTARGRDALEALANLKSNKQSVPLIAVDSHVSDMAAIDVCREAVGVFQDARRVLLIECAQENAAIAAVKARQVDDYVVGPWQPPDQRLYPVLNELLADWEAHFRPPFAGLQVIGSRFSRQSHETRDFLVRNCAPYQWLDIERDEEARRTLERTGISASQLPLVRLPDGTQLVQPTNADLAEKIGLQVHAREKFYDLVIVGGGPAGLAAAVYGASEGLRTIMVERHAPGGQAGLSAMIENYLGFPAGLGGAELARRAVAQARKFDVEIVTPKVVTAVRPEQDSRVITLSDGSELRCHVVLLATGVEWRRLEVPMIERFTGAGVYYGGTLAEAMFCRGEDIHIVGGANSAGQAALYFARYARTVTMLVRDDSLSQSMSRYLIEQIEATKNITVRFRTTVVGVQGKDRLEAITVRDAASSAEETLRTSALFIFIGALPHTEYLEGVVERDDHGFILTGPDLPGSNGDDRRPRGWSLDRDPFWLESSVPGVFVAGDVRHGSVKRIAAGVGEGAMAVQFIHQYLR